jgi:hypothetical protein
MGNEWEVQLFDYDGGQGWVTVESFEGSPRKALKVLKRVRRNADPGVAAFQLIWRGRD